MRRLAPSLAPSVLALLALALPRLALAQPVTPAPTEADATSTPSAEHEARRRALLRRGGTYLGPVGGIHVVEAGSGAPRSFRLQLFTDFFFKNDYLYDGDEARYVGGALSLGITPIEHLEVSAAVTTRSLRNSYRPPDGDGSEVVQSVGDPYLDVKGYGEVAKGVTLGGDVLLAFLTAPSDDTLDYVGTSVGLRGNLSFDLRQMASALPLELRMNLGYYFDQSRKIVADNERDRLAALRANGLTSDTTGDDEFRHLAYRNERLAYAVNRVDHASVALGLEAPLALSERVALHPLLEWEMWLPINRQGYDCPRVTLASGAKLPGDDGCLDTEGADTFPQRITAGARLYPALPGFSLLAAIEVGLGGATNFVRELAPNAPYRVMLAATYAVDLAPKREVKQVERRIEIPVAPKLGRLRGRIVEQGAGTPVESARVTVDGSDLSPLVSDADGRFVGCTFPPGEVRLGLAADGYEPGVCTARIPDQGGDAAADCALVALPRVGSLALRVLGEGGAQLVGATVQLTGPLARTATTAADGSVREAELPPGEYQVRIDHPGHLLSVTPVRVDARKETTLQLSLTPKPARPLVVVQKTRLTLRGTVYFNTGTADLSPKSEPLLREVADVLLRMQEITRVEVQGHTDNVGAPEHNRALSASRAEAVRDFLVRAGVAIERLDAKGYGATQPVAPNIVESGRAKNRRVAFIITERASSLPTLQ